jgi:beta-glucanase (GH16 family)
VQLLLLSLVTAYLSRSLAPLSLLNTSLSLQLLRRSGWACSCATTTLLSAPFDSKIHSDMSRLLLLPLALLATYASAQTSTECNPLNATCPDDAALGTTYNKTFSAADTGLSTSYWNITAGTPQFTDKGAEFVLNKKGDSVTAETTFYIFWGTVEVIMQAAKGAGLVSTFDLLSDDLDEIDLEILGGNSSYVESNWYGWGNRSQYNSEYHPCDGPADGMHNYTFVWGQDQLQWIIDGSVARTVPYAPPSHYPQTPSKLVIGIWAGGDSESNGTATWAGGPVDWSQA